MKLTFEWYISISWRTDCLLHLYCIWKPFQGASKGNAPTIRAFLFHCRWPFWFSHAGLFRIECVSTVDGFTLSRTSVQEKIDINDSLYHRSPSLQTFWGSCQRWWLKTVIENNLHGKVRTFGAKLYFSWLDKWNGLPFLINISTWYLEWQSHEKMIRHSLDKPCAL